MKCRSAAQARAPREGARRAAFRLVTKHALSTTPSPSFVVHSRDRSVGLCRVKARGAVSVAALHPAPTPRLLP